MARYRCNSCGGEYDDKLPDGTLYFHACPPIANPVTGETRERADKRDENIGPDGKIKAEGKGRTKLEARRSEDRALRVAVDVKGADAAYRPFPSFEEWSKCTVDTVRWDRYTALLQKRGELSPDLLRRSYEVAKRAAAVDTGAIEGLYEVDRGFTFTVATQTALWEADLDAKGPKARALIESQLRAYDYVLDLATQRTPVAEAWIRTLHEELCRAQETYTAYTEVGLQTLPLPLGQYKQLPNHVRQPDGRIHSYAPVDLTPAEMHRLCAELRSEAFLGAHPVLQASYAHYALVAIHPFADGNGRVARAFASVFTYRCNSIPVLVLADNRADYYSALEAADNRQFQPFLDFFLERSLDAMLLVSESLRAAISPQAPQEFAALKRLYVTRGGYTHGEVDEAAYSLLLALQKEALERAGSFTVKDEILIEIVQVSGSTHPVEGAYRLPIRQGPRGLRVVFRSMPPAAGDTQRLLALEVPKDCGLEDDLIIRNLHNGETFAARATEIIPHLTAALQMRISLFTEKVFGEALAELLSKAKEELRKQGY